MDSRSAPVSEAHEAHEHLERETMPILPRRFHALVRQALSGHLTEMQGVPDLNKHVIAWTVSYVLGDRAHVIERLDTVYRHLNPGALPYRDEMDLPSFDPLAVRRPRPPDPSAPKKFPSKDYPAGKGGKPPPKGTPRKPKSQKAPPPPKPDFQQRILF
jgi:hypothetical protein